MVEELDMQLPGVPPEDLVGMNRALADWEAEGAGPAPEAESSAGATPQQALGAK